MNDIPAGEKLYRPYAHDYSNVELMSRFGIIEHDNPNKVQVKLRHNMLKDDPLINVKMHVLG